MLAVVLVDKLGRKILLISSSIIMCISIVGLGVYFYLDECKDPNIRPDKTDCTDISNLGWLPLVTIKNNTVSEVLYLICYMNKYALD